jgi:hypothetical protein
VTKIEQAPLVSERSNFDVIDISWVWIYDIQGTAELTEDAQGVAVLSKAAPAGSNRASNRAGESW